MKQWRSETQEVLSVSNSHFLYSVTGFLVFQPFPIFIFFSLLYIFSLWSFFPLCVSNSPFLQPLQLLAVQTVFLLFPFLSPSLSQPGLFRYLRFFIFNHFLLYCLSACHCLACLSLLPSPCGQIIISFLCLNQSLTMEFFFNLA